jgi:hypothetical protein
VKLQIAQRFSDYDADRQIYLRRCRALARATDYTLLPYDKDIKATEQYVRQYQSSGPQALNLIESQFFFACYTPGLPWFASPLDARIIFDPAIPNDAKNEAMNLALLRDLTLHAAMEQTARDGALGFYESQRQLIRAVVAFGSGLQLMHDDQTCQNFRLDQFVTQRDCKGSPVEHVTKECVDPMTLTDEQLANVALDREQLRTKKRKERQKDLYTWVDYDSQNEEWVTWQEIDGNQLQEERRENVCRYIAPAIRLAAGDHYGTSPLLAHLPTFAALDELGLRRLETAAIVSSVKWAVNHGSPTDPEHLKWPSGSVLRASVVGGQVGDVAALYANVGNSPNVVQQAISEMEMGVAQSLGLIAPSLPNVDRVTATQVERVSNQLEQIMGGALSSYQATSQPHQIQVVMNDLKSILPKIPDQWKSYISPKVLTGTAQAVRQVKSSRLASVVQLAAQMGEGVLTKLNLDQIFQAVLRYEAVFEPGMVKSPEQQQAEAEAAAQLQVQTQAAMDGGRDAARTAGAVMQQQLAPQ